MRTAFIICFLICNTIIAQTSFSEADIYAAAGNEHETLLTNVEPTYPDTSIQAFLQTSLMMYEESNKVSKYELYRVYKNKSNFKTTESRLFYKISTKPVSGYKYGISSKIEIWGDYEKVVRFFCQYWTNSINFDDIKRGESASTRFLTDFATLSFSPDGSAKIIVVSTKDRA